jgi:hypothetical protein
MKINLNWLIIFSLPVIFTFSKCKSDYSPKDLTIIRKRIMDLNTGNGASGNGVHKKETLADLETSAKFILERGGHLNEFDLNAPGVENKVSAVFGMIQTLAKAYRTEGQKYYHSEEVLKEITKGLQHGQKWIKPGTPRPGNWYYWKIDAPRNLEPALILMQEYLDKDLMKSLQECLLDVMTKGEYNKQGYILTGANGAMMGMNFIYYAVLADDEKMLKLGLDLI